MPNFHTQLGDPNHPGRKLPAERHFEPGQNPYVTGHELAPDSPVFFGREEVIQAIRARLLSPAKPQSVSLLGERRSGKSSLLNQLRLSLAQEPNLLLLQTNTQNWNHIDPAGFFSSLHLALCQGLQLDTPPAPCQEFEPLRDRLERFAQSHRFVVLFDEFERLADNPKLGADFFANLRNYADEKITRQVLIFAPAGFGHGLKMASLCSFLENY